MDLFFLDFESPYSKRDKFDIKSMGMENYVNDPRFHILMCSVKRIPNWDFSRAEKTYLLHSSHEETVEHLRSLDLHKHAVGAQNTMFDGLILDVHAGIFPKFYVDTLSMARPILGSFSKKLGLAQLAKWFGVGEKGEEVVLADGKFCKADFTPYEWEQYGKYCVKDDDLTALVFRRMMMHIRPQMPPGWTNAGFPIPGQEAKRAKAKLIPFPQEELRTIDLTLRMYLQPTLELSLPTLEENQRLTKEKKGKILADMEVRGITKKVLRSNQQFRALLESKGVEVPMKPSPTSLKRRDNPVKMTEAFSKTDEGFKQLQEEYADDLEISMLLNARISEKSTQEETRTARLIEIAKRYPKLRVPISYSGAHTTRDSGTGGINLHNPPKVSKSRMRYAIVAPPGHVILDPDAAQIEARLVAYCAGQNDLVEQFRRGDDVYSIFASKIYGRKIDRKRFEMRDGKKFYPDEKEGKVGKEGILGLGFGMGGEKFRITLAGKADVKVPLETATEYVYTYRNTYSMIPELWAAAEEALRKAVMYGDTTKVSVFEIGPEGIVFPNGMWIPYPNLKIVDGEFRYQRAKDNWPQNLFGGKVTENFIQKVARDITFGQGLKLYRETGKRYALRAHDSLPFVVPEDEVEDFKKIVVEVFSEPPPYMPGLPLKGECVVGRSYGDT